MAPTPVLIIARLGIHMTPYSDEWVLLDLVLQHRKLKDDKYWVGVNIDPPTRQIDRLSGMIRRMARKMLKAQKGPEADNRQLSLMDLPGVASSWGDADREALD